MFDINSWMARKRLKQKDVAKMLGCSMGVVASWCVNRKQPSYKYIVQLFQNGMTLNEMFDDELASIITSNNSQSSEDFKEGMKEMLEEILREKFTK